MKYLLVLLLIFPPYGLFSQITSAQQYYSLGLRTEKQDAKKAIPYLLKAASLALTNSDLQFHAAIEASRLAYYNEIYERECFELIRSKIKSLSKINRKDSLAGEIYYSGGQLYVTYEKPDSAIICYERAKQIFIDNYGNDHIKVGRCFNEMGDIYKYDLYDFTAAEKNNEQALAIYEKHGSKDHRAIARIYYSLAAINRSQKDYQKALSLGMKMIDMVEKLNDNTFLERAYFTVANIYSDLHEFDASEKLYSKSIALNKSINKEDNELLADNYLGLGQSLKAQKKYREAEINLAMAISIYKRLKRLDRILLVNSLQQLAEIKLAEKRQDESYELLKEARGILSKLNRERSGQSAMLYKVIGDFYKEKKDYDSSLFYYQKSLISVTDRFNSLSYTETPALTDFVLKNFAYEILLAKADGLILLYSTSKRENDIKLALKCFSVAETLLSQSRDDLDQEDAKWVFLDANFELYEKAVAAIYNLMSNDYADSLNEIAFRYFESSKSKTLGDALVQAVSLDSLISKDKLFGLMNDYKINLLTIQDQLRKFDANNQQDQIKTDAMHNEIVENDKQIRQTEEMIRIKYPSYLKIRKEYRYPGIYEIQSEIRNDDVVLEYFWGVQDVYAVGITASEITFKKIGPINVIQNEINEFLLFFKERLSSYSQKDINRYSQMSYSLFRLLVRPFQEVVTHKDHLIIIPDGLVGQVPFEVLTKSGKTNANFKELDYLIGEFTIAYMFSSSFLLNRKQEKIESPKMLAFGFTNGYGQRSSPQDISYQLNGTDEEISALISKFPNGQFFSGRDVTELNFKKGASEADILHLAIHGKGDTDQNYSASLFFTDKKNQSKEDGELHWYELYSMKLKSILTVLSSCESGIGKSYKGEGMLSMASAFAYAGSKNIVMGLWKVDDRVSVKLMYEFYRELSKGKTVDEALTHSKRRYLEEADELTANPKMWGSLVSYGNQSIISNDKGSWIFVSIASLIVTITIFFYTKRRKPF